MSCFIGLSLQQTLSQKAYQQALSEIQDYISSTNYQILPNQKIFMLSNRYQRFCLPKNSDYIHSNLQHFIISQQEDQKYIEAIVQCLMILKQHFPHKIQIEMVSDCQQIFNLKVKTQQQIPRRLISRLKILYQKCKKNDVKQQQVHMLIKNLNTQFHKDYSQKLKMMSLKILSQGKIDSKVWDTLTKRQVKIIDQIVNEPVYQRIGIQILQRIVRKNDYKVYLTQNQKQNQSPNSFAQQLIRQNQKVPEYGPLDTMSALFQLKQSMVISRLTWIIQNVDHQNLDNKKLNKYDARIKQVAERFVNDFYPICCINQLRSFGQSLAQYQMRRTNLSWEGLIQQVLMKIQAIQKQLIKSKNGINHENYYVKH